MKRILIISLIILINKFSYSQTIEKDKVFELSLKSENHKYCDFLTKLEITDALPFGLNQLNCKDFKPILYETGLWKSPEIKIKKNKNIATITYYFYDNVLNKIELKTKSYSEFIDNLIKEQFGESYDRDEANSFLKIKYVNSDYALYYLPYWNKIEIFALAYQPLDKRYDEFSDLGLVLIKNDLSYIIIKGGCSSLDFYYSYRKKVDEKKIGFRIEYINDDWMFMNKIQFLFENGEIETFNLEPSRDTRSYGGVDEKELVSITEEFALKLANSGKVKVKVSGEKSNFVFTLNEIHKDGIKTMLDLYNKGFKDNL